MRAPDLLRLPDGRRLAFDDVGDRHGPLVVYLHGTPDSRLARHPDDEVARALGVRLVAIDRPGAGASDANPTASPASFGHDLVDLLDHLGVAAAGLLAWSAGALAALAAAGHVGSRVERLVLVGAVPPVEAYADRDVVAGLGPRRRTLAELAVEIPADQLAAELAAHLVPEPLTPELALEHVLEGAGERGRAELATVPGAAAQMARSLQAAVAQGTAWIEQDLRHQLTPGLDLAAVGTEVHAVHGGDDDVAPPAVGEWLAARLPRSRLDVVPAAGHHLLFPRWADLLALAAGRGGSLA